MKRYFNNKNGSTLVLLVIVIAIIAVLGTSVLGVTMMNFKIKKTNTAIKQSFYLSESGLDKAYDRAYDIVVDAINKSNSVAQGFLQEFTPTKLEELIEYSKDRDPIDPENEKYLVYIKDSDDDAIADSYNEANIQKDAKDKFYSEYKTYIDANINKLAGNYTVASKDGNKVVVGLTNKGWSGDKETGELTLELESTYKNKDNIQKETAVNLVLSTPEYSTPYTISTELVPVNQYWTKMLTAENLYIKNNSTFNGDVYVSNNLKMNSSSTASTTANFNDILAVKGEDGTTLIGGIELKAANSTLNSKNVYANNIWLNGTGSAFNSSGLGVYVKDDLEMNNNKQSVNIAGSYYGFGYGGTGGLGDNTLNSAIIINSDDISADSGSSLNIDKDLYLLGTAYIQNLKKDDENAIYATGESISIRGNYLAYSMPLNTEDYSNPADERYITPGSDEYSDLEKLKGDNVTFELYEPLPPVITKYRSGSTIYPWDKSEYLYFYNKKTENTGSNELNLGGDNITIGTVDSDKMITLGAGIDRGKIDYSIDEEDKFTVSDYHLGSYWDNEQKDWINEYDLYIKYFGAAELMGTDELRFSDQVKPIDDTNEKNEIYKSGVLYNMADATYSMSAGNYEGLLVTNKPIVISGNVNFTGLIVTSNDITINGELDYKGTIICGGDITINGKTTIAYDEGVVKKHVKENKLYDSVFVSGTSTKKFITLYKTSSGATVDVEDFRSLLKFNSWNMSD